MRSTCRRVLALTSACLLATGCSWWARANVSTDGSVVAEPEDYYATLSADGRYVAFHTLGALHPEDGPATDIYRRDLLTGDVELVSRGENGGATVGNASSYLAHVSADGRHVAFTSWADNLVPGDTNGWADVFLRDIDGGTTTRVSVTSDGSEASAESWIAGVSAEGRYVTFMSFANDLIADDTNEETDVFRHDTVTGETVRVSAPFDGHGGGGWRPAVDPAGNVVAYEAPPTAVPGINPSYDVILATDIAAGTTEPAIVRSDGSPVEGGRLMDLSAGGRFVLFTTSFALEPMDLNGAVDLYVHDRQTRSFSRANVAGDGHEVNGNADRAAISDDGRFVVFDSYDATLEWGTHVRDLHDGDLTTPTAEGGVNGGGNEGTHPAISADGRTVAFEGLSVTAQNPWGPYDLFVVANPTPMIEEIVPSTVGPGSNLVTVVGTGLLVGTELQVDDPAVTITVDGIAGGTSLAATITVAAGASTDTADIVAWNPPTGAGRGSSTVCVDCLTVVSP